MAARPDLSIIPEKGASLLQFRALGRAGDLDLDLASTDRLGMVTAVLAACAQPPQDDQSIWALTLAARIGGLLSIWAKGAATDFLDVGLRCPAPGCAADLEVALPVPALMDLAHAAGSTPILETEGLTLRRPTGLDQRLWQSAAQPDPEGVILTSLALRGSVPTNPAARQALDESLAEFDPLPCFAVTITCPDCGTESTLPVDLEALLLARLARIQDGLFSQVDRLARRYGWSDEAILAMPPRRRARYLRLADQAEAGT